MFQRIHHRAFDHVRAQLTADGGIIGLPLFPDLTRVAVVEGQVKRGGNFSRHQCWLFPEIWREAVDKIGQEGKLLEEGERKMDAESQFFRVSRSHGGANDHACFLPERNPLISWLPGMELCAPFHAEQCCGLFGPAEAILP